MSCHNNTEPWRAAIPPALLSKVGNMNEQHEMVVNAVNSWFKHILFMMKKIGRGLNATRALSWKEYLLNRNICE